MRMFRRIKGVTLKYKVKSVDLRKELVVNSIQEKVREINYAGLNPCREWKKTTK